VQLLHALQLPCLSGCITANVWHVPKGQSACNHRHNNQRCTSAAVVPAASAQGFPSDANSIYEAGLTVGKGKVGQPKLSHTNPASTASGDMHAHRMQSDANALATVSRCAYITFTGIYSLALLPAALAVGAKSAAGFGSACFVWDICMHVHNSAACADLTYINAPLPAVWLPAARALTRPSTARTSTSSGAPSATCTWRTSTSWVAHTSGTGERLQWCHLRRKLF
jgi:hypothetical protein